MVMKGVKITLFCGLQLGMFVLRVVPRALLKLRDQLKMNEDGKQIY